MRLDFFNVDEQGARLLIDNYVPLRPEAMGDWPPTVLVVGLHLLGQAVVAELARQWHVNGRANEQRVEIVTIDTEASRIVKRLQRRHPQLEHAADVTAIDASVEPLETDGLATLRPDIALVCIGDDGAGLHTALRLRGFFPDPATRIVVELVRADGIASLVDHPGQPNHVEVFNLYERTMRPELLLGGTYELLARAIHDAYVAERLGPDIDTDTNPALVVWEELPDALKESNRDQAADIGTKLAALGRGIAPLTEWDADLSVFSDDEIEHLAELEHARWVDQRRLDGWTSGVKDIEAKTTPYLVAWDALSDEVKEWDRQTVRKIPSFLARVGYQIVTPTAP